MNDPTKAADERLRRKRRDQGLDPDTGLAAPIPKLGEELTAIMSRGASFAVPPMPKGMPPPRPSLATIPEKFRSITWDALATLKNPDGCASLGGVYGPGGVALVGAEAVEEIRCRVSGADRVVLLGETHAGKTIVASAILNEAAELGANHAAARERGEAKGYMREERPRFVREVDLRDPDVLARARTAGVLVLDNMGWALDGAPKDSPLAAHKRGPTCDLLDALACRRIGSFRLIVTTWLDQGAMSDAYSGGVVARVYEGSEVIRIARFGEVSQ